MFSFEKEIVFNISIGIIFLIIFEAVIFLIYHLSSRFCCTLAILFSKPFVIRTVFILVNKILQVCLCVKIYLVILMLF